MEDYKFMPDYKEMYFHLMHATEKAIRVLIQAQQECEEMYLSAPEREIIVLPKETESKNK